MISRLRTNNNLFGEPVSPMKRKQGRPRKYGAKLGTASSLAWQYKEQAQEYTVNLYGKDRTILAYDRVVMLKSLKCRVRVVWIFRKTQWIALFTTDLTLTVEEIIEYYGARWKIEAFFKELKRDIGSAETQTRNSVAVTNHLEFCMMRGVSHPGGAGEPWTVVRCYMGWLRCADNNLIMPGQKGC